MAKKEAGGTPAQADGRKVLNVEPGAANSNKDHVLARLTLRPDVQAGYLIQSFAGVSLDVTAAVGRAPR
jgi:hypothetical protein